MASTTHDPKVFLGGSGSLLNPVDAPLQEAEPDPIAEGAGAVDLQFTEWPDPAWAGWHSLVLTSLAAPTQHLALLRQRGIDYLVVGRGRVALRRSIVLLGEHLGIQTVVATGGGRVGGALLRQHLIDEIDLELLPWAIGGRGTPNLLDAAPLTPDEWPTRLDLVS